MGFLWALGGIAAGTLLALIGGVILEYAQRLGWVVGVGEQWLLLPVVTGLAGMLGASVAVSMYGRYLRGRSQKQAVKATGAGVSGTKSASRGMEHVPGMPTFDVAGIKHGEHRADSTTTMTPPKTPEQPS